jgi:hypothetical protein
MKINDLFVQYLNKPPRLRYYIFWDEWKPIFFPELYILTYAI